MIVYNTLDIRDTFITNIPEDCLAHNIYCNFELKDKRYELFAMNTFYHYVIKPELIHIKHLDHEFLHIYDTLSKIIEKEENQYYIKIGVNGPIRYAVTDNKGTWAIGKTTSIANRKLLFLKSKGNKSKYQGLSLDSELLFDEAVICYRVITEACGPGVEKYIETRLPKPHKEKYTIREIIELTKSEYSGWIFEQFFTK